MKRWSAPVLGSILLVTAAPADAGPVKPRLQGLLAMGNIAFHRRADGVPDNGLADILAIPPGTISGFVINIGWNQVQPIPDSLDTSAIDTALAQIRAYNLQHPQTPIHAKLRIWQGVTSPDWVKQIGGAPVTLALDGGTRPLTVPRFWDPQVRSAWRKMQTMLAHKYDAEPLVREVSNSSCSSLTDEGFIIEGDAISIGNMIASGFSDEAYRTCLIESVLDYSAWRMTSIDYAVGGYRVIADGSLRKDETVDDEVVATFRRVLGARGILTNHALAPPDSLAARGLMPTMRLIARYGPPIEFQTANPHAPWLPGQKLDWNATIDFGVSLKAGAIELWGQSGKDPGFKAFAPDRLDAWSAALVANR